VVQAGKHPRANPTTLDCGMLPSYFSHYSV
jgi:hypothetical protein